MPRGFGEFDEDEVEETDEEPEETEEEPEEEEIDIDALVAEKVREQTAQIEARLGTFRQGLRNRGVDIGDDGDLVVRDPSKARSYFGGEGAPAPKPAPEAMPDPIDNPQGYREWMAKETSRQISEAVAQATKPIVEELQSTRSALLKGRAKDAVAEVKGLLEEVGFEEITELPGFAETYREALQSLTPDQVQDPDTLVRMALLIAPELKRAAPRKKPETRSADGRYQQARRTLAGQVAPSKEAGGRPSKSQVTDFERQAAEMLGISVAEVQALGDPTGRAYASLKKGTK